MNWDLFSKSNEMIKEKESLLHVKKLSVEKLTKEKVILQKKMTSLEESITKIHSNKVEKAVQTVSAVNKDCTNSQSKLTLANIKNAELMEVNLILITKDIKKEKSHQKKISQLQFQVDGFSTNQRECQLECKINCEELSKTKAVLKEKESLLYEETKNKGKLTEVIVNLRKQVTSLEENTAKRQSDKVEKGVQTFFSGIRNVKRKRNGAESVLPQSIANSTGKGIINDYSVSFYCSS
jgi:hypothetical protein